MQRGCPAAGSQHRCAGHPGSLMLSLIAQHEAALRIACGDVPAAQRIIRELPASPERTLLWVRANLRGNETASRRTLTAMSPATARGKAERHLLHAAAESPRSTRLAQGHLRRAAEIAASCGMATLMRLPRWTCRAGRGTCRFRRPGLARVVVAGHPRGDSGLPTSARRTSAARATERR